MSLDQASSTVASDLVPDELFERRSLVRYDEDLIDAKGKAVNGKARTQNKDESQLQQILNSVLPPIHVGDDVYKQVSQEVPDRAEVGELQRAWDQELQERQARESGICAIRESLNAQAFDELIRQVTVNMPERGVLLVRARDEAKMTVDTYQTLYQTSLAFGMRKCVESSQHNQVLQDKVQKERQILASLTQQAHDLRNELESRQKHWTDVKRAESKSQGEGIEFVKHQKQALENALADFSR